MLPFMGMIMFCQAFSRFAPKTALETLYRVVVWQAFLKEQENTRKGETINIMLAERKTNQGNTFSKKANRTNRTYHFKVPKLNGVNIWCCPECG
jgi:hypothetical protein